MRIILIDFPSRISRDDYCRLLRETSPQRTEKAVLYSSDSDRTQSILAFHLLAEGLGKNFNFNGIPEFVFNEYGKPYLKSRRDIFFNLSHCDQAVICAIDDKDIGVDVESIPERIDMDEMKFCFNKDEISDILSSPDPCIRFAEWWTRKESYLKLIGTGLTDDMPSVLSEDVISGLDYDTFIDPERRFVYSVCQFKSGLEQTLQLI